MKIAIFGAAGRTGKHIVNQALEKGYQVVAFTRPASRRDVHNKNLTIIQGDVRDANKV